jgi:hypothetical protein
MPDAGLTYTPGQTIRVHYIAAPRVGSIDLDDITVTRRDPNGDNDDLTSLLVQDEANAFHVDITVAEPAGSWWVNFTSNLPSPEDSFEITYVVREAH